MSAAIVLRIQDRFGRGPYRPGMSRRWSDPNGYDCPPWWIELGETCEVAHARMAGAFHFGCAFRSRAQLDAWFNSKEQCALERLGYKVCEVSADIIVAETPRQVVFGSIKPLSLPLSSRRITSLAGRALAA